MASLNPSQPPFAKGRGNYPPLEKGDSGGFSYFAGDVAVMKHYLENNASITLSPGRGEGEGGNLAFSKGDSAEICNPSTYPS